MRGVREACIVSGSIRTSPCGARNRAQRDRPLDGAGFVRARFGHRERKQAHREIGGLRVGRYDRTVRKPRVIGFDEPVILRRVERREIDARCDVAVDRRRSDRRELRLRERTACDRNLARLIDAAAAAGGAQIAKELIGGFADQRVENEGRARGEDRVDHLAELCAADRKIPLGHNRTAAGPIASRRIRLFSHAQM